MTWMRISHNGSDWRYHEVTTTFLARLRAWLDARPHLDTVLQELTETGWA